MVIAGLFEDDYSVDDKPAPGTKPARSRRPKYTPVACFECQRRKAKCSGDQECSLCRTRGVACVYPAQSQRIRRRRGINATASPRGELDRDQGPRKVRQPTVRQQQQQQQQRPQEQWYPDKQSSLEKRVNELETALGNMVSLHSASPPDPNSYVYSAPAFLSGATTHSGAGYHRDSKKDHAIHDGNTDLLTVRSDQYIPGNISLPGMVSVTRHLLQLGPLNDRVLLSHSQGGVSIRLPGMISMQTALECCARNLAVYLPALENANLEPTIILGTSNASGGKPMDTLVQPQNLAEVSQLYMTLALWQCFDSQLDRTDLELSPDWKFYTQGLRLIEKAPPIPSTCYTMATCHLLRATYLTQGDMLQAALSAIWSAVSFALQASLNSEAAWKNCTSTEVRRRKILWWSIYCLERRLAQKCGLPSIIRDDNTTVSDMCTREELDKYAASDEIPDPEKLSDLYLQVLIGLSRLWGKVWDTLFKLNSNNEDQEEIEILDARLERFQRGLPCCLRWDDDTVRKFGNNSDNDLLFRRKHTIHTRINLLRLFIRQNPTNRGHLSPRAAHFCATATDRTVTALTSFVSALPGQRLKASSYFVTSSLLECLYQAARVLDNPRASDDHKMAISSIRMIHQTLKKMAPDMSIPRKVLKDLNLMSTESRQAQQSNPDQCEEDNGLSGNSSWSLASLATNASSMVGFSTLGANSGDLIDPRLGGIGAYDENHTSSTPDAQFQFSPTSFALSGFNDADILGGADFGDLSFLQEGSNDRPLDL